MTTEACLALSSRGWIDSIGRTSDVEVERRDSRSGSKDQFLLWHPVLSQRIASKGLPGRKADGEVAYPLTDTWSDLK